MDLELELEEREKNNMEIMLDGLTLEIPEKLVKEHLEIYGCGNQELHEVLTEQANAYKKCLISNNEYQKCSFEKMFINHIDNGLAFYRTE